MLHGLLALVFLSVGAVWLHGRVVGGLRDRVRAGRVDRAARSAARLVSGLNMTFLIGLPAVLAVDPLGITYGASPAVVVLLTVPLFTTAMTPGLLFLNVLVWKWGHLSHFDRWHHSLGTLAALAFIPYLMYWNLLGFRY